MNSRIHLHLLHRLHLLIQEVFQDIVIHHHRLHLHQYAINIEATFLEKGGKEDITIMGNYINDELFNIQQLVLGEFIDLLTPNCSEQAFLLRRDRKQCLQAPTLIKRHPYIKIPECNFVLSYIISLSLKSSTKETRQYYHKKIEIFESVYSGILSIMV